MRILQLSDLHLPAPHQPMPVPGPAREAYLERLGDALREIPADLVVLSGDLAATDPSDDVYEELAALLARCAGGRPVVAIPGNHDVGASLEQWFPAPGEVLSRGPEHCLSVEVAGQRLYFLDSGPGVVAPDALGWLRAEVVGASDRVHLFMHHPPLLAGVPFMDRNYPLANRDEVLAVLEAAPAGVAVFCGHYHCAREVVRGQVSVHLAPSALFQLDPEAGGLALLHTPPACRLVEIHEGGYRTWLREL